MLANLTAPNEANIKPLAEKENLDSSDTNFFTMDENGDERQEENEQSNLLGEFKVEHSHREESNNRDEEDDEVLSRGMLCILPPSMYSFLFGEDKKEL